MNQDVVRRNNVKVFGSGTQPMLFAHGFGCDQNMWRFVTPAFENDYRIILFDYVGSGHSDLESYDAERYSDLKGYAADVLDIVRELDLEKVEFSRTHWPFLRDRRIEAYGNLTKRFVDQLS